MTDQGSGSRSHRPPLHDLRGHDRPIVVALSGGGVRALAFHLGVLGRLAAGGLLEHVTHFSSVSGGSLGLAIMLSLQGNRWPSSSEYVNELQPAARNLLITTDLETSMVRRVMRKPNLLASRGLVFAHVLKSLWGVTARLRDLPAEPEWIINATVEEWGQSWSFTSRWMGSPELGYLSDPSLTLAEAVAASSAVPPLLGPFALTADTELTRVPGSAVGTEYATNGSMKRIHLWDGGLCDNFGIEGLLRAGTPLDQSPNAFLIMSDASAASRTVRGHLVRQAILRWLDIPEDSERVQRARGVIERLELEPASGVYLQIGTPSRRIGRVAVRDSGLPDGYLEEGTIRRAAQHPTRLNRLTAHGFDSLYRHGWEALDSRLAAHRPCIVKLPTRAD